MGTRLGPAARAIRSSVRLGGRPRDSAAPWPWALSALSSAVAALHHGPGPGRRPPPWHGMVAAGRPCPSLCWLPAVGRPVGRSAGRPVGRSVGGVRGRESLPGDSQMFRIDRSTTSKENDVLHPPSHSPRPPTSSLIRFDSPSSPPPASSLILLDSHPPHLSSDLITPRLIPHPS